MNAGNDHVLRLYFPEFAFGIVGVLVVTVSGYFALLTLMEK